MPKMLWLILGWSLMGSLAQAESPTQRLLHLIPEETRILAFCDVDQVREGEFLPAQAFEMLHRYIYAEYILGRDRGIPPALPCKKVHALVLAGGKNALQGVAIFRCEGLDRERLFRDLEASDNTQKMKASPIPNLVIYHRKDPPGRKADGLAGLLRTHLGLLREAWVAALDDRTLIVSNRDASDIIRAARLLKSPVRPVLHERLRPALERLDLAGDLCGVALSGEVLPTQVAWIVPGNLKPLFHPLRHLAVTARGTDPTRIRAHATTERSDHARELEKCLEDHFVSWRDRTNHLKWALAAYGAGRLAGALNPIPESVREMGELAMVAADAARRLEVSRSEKDIEVRCRLEAREIEVFLRVLRPHLPPAR